MTMPRIPLDDLPPRRGSNNPQAEEEERRRRMGGQGGGRGLLSPFLPGDKGLLAQQLSQGFGGDPQSYMKQLSMMYQPMRMGFKFGGGGGGFGNMGGGMGTGGPTLPTEPMGDPNYRLSPVGWSPR